jgi:hypothetical protein
MNADSVTESFLCSRVNATADSATGGYPAEAPALASKLFSAHGRRRVCYGGTTGFARGAPFYLVCAQMAYCFRFSFFLLLCGVDVSSLWAREKDGGRNPELFGGFIHLVVR